MQITERYRPKKKILTKKEAQLKLKKTDGTISYEESKSRSKDRSL